MRIRLALAVCLSCSSAYPAMAETKREVLYSIVGDFDHDGTPDRAVLIVEGPGMTPDATDLANDRHWMQENEKIDLAIYLGSGNAPPDLSKPPSFEKDDFANSDRDQDYILPLEVNKAGALKVATSSRWGSSHQSVETLTVLLLKGVPTVIGYDFNWQLPGGDSAGCSIDLQKGNAVADDNNRKTKSKVKAGVIALRDWKGPMWPKLCGNF